MIGYYKRCLLKGKIISDQFHSTNSFKAFLWNGTDSNYIEISQIPPQNFCTIFAYYFIHLLLSMLLHNHSVCGELNIYRYFVDFVQTPSPVFVCTRLLSCWLVVVYIILSTKCCLCPAVRLLYYSQVFLHLLSAQSRYSFFSSEGSKTNYYTILFLALHLSMSGRYCS